MSFYIYDGVGAVPRALNPPMGIVVRAARATARACSPADVVRWISALRVEMSAVRMDTASDRALVDRWRASIAELEVTYRACAALSAPAVAPPAASAAAVRATSGR